MHKPNTATMMDNYIYCVDCEWPVVHCCANDAMYSDEADYVIYCSNKGCRNHAGTPMGFNDWPTWLASSMPRIKKRNSYVL